MATQHVEVQRRFAASPEAVFDRYVDHARWSEWAGTPGSKLVREGHPDRNGVGAVRQFAGIVREEVTEFERPQRMAYRVTRGVPIRAHSGEVTFDPDGDGGTLVTWRCQFTEMIPGTRGLLQRQFTATFRKALEGLATKGLTEPRS